MIGQYRINNVNHEIVGGKYMIGGQVHNIIGGKYKYNNVVYNISFGPRPMPTVTQEKGSSIRISSDSPFSVSIRKPYYTGYTCQYSTNNVTFQNVNPTTYYDAQQYSDGYAIYFRSSSRISPRTSNSMFVFNSSDANFRFAVSGEILNLVDYIDWSIQASNLHLDYLFYGTNVANLKDFSMRLRAETDVISYMFGNCSHIETLPTIKLSSPGTPASASFRSAFSGVTNELKKAYTFVNIPVIFTTSNAFREAFVNFEFSTVKDTTYTKTIVVPKSTGSNSLLNYCKDQNGSSFTPTSGQKLYVKSDVELVPIQWLG